MEKQHNYHRYGILLSVAIVLVFLVLALLRLYPFQNNLAAIVADTGNDWGSYATYALDIKNNGFFMPSVNEAYVKPGSFFYSYFLAACFWLFGENDVPVFILQNIMLGLSIVIIYHTFRDKMKAQTGVLFLAALFLFALPDVSRYYTFRFLGENLALFTLALFFYCFIKGTEKNKLSLLLTAAVLMGISVLTRPNILAFAVLLIFIAFMFFRKKENTVPRFAAFTGVLLLSVSFLALRNYTSCGSLNFLPAQGFAFNFVAFHPIPLSVDVSQVVHNGHDISTYTAAYGEYIRQQPALFFGHYFNKLLFCFGFLNAVVPSYHWFPHWTLMWVGYFIYLSIAFKNKVKFSAGELAVHLFIFTYYGTLILIGQVENYGFRMLIPANFFVLPFSFIALEKIVSATMKGAYSVSSSVVEKP